jgi:hypothetical protein
MQDKHRVFAPDGRCGPSLLPSSNTEQNIVAEGLPNTGILGRAFSIERELTMTPVPVARQRRKFQSPNLPFDYGRRSNSRGFPEYGRSLLSGTRPMPFLYSGRKSKTHGCVEEREGSRDRHSEWGRFLRRRLPHRAVLRMCSAITMSDCTVMRIEKKSMMDVIHREGAFSHVRGTC